MIVTMNNTNQINGDNKNDNYIFNDSNIVLPFWKTNIMFNETIIFLRNDANIVLSGGLAFTPLKIFSVQNYSMDINYVEGVDWELKAGRIVRLENSKIPFITFNQYKGLEPLEGASTWNSSIFPSGKILFAGDDAIVKNSICITYLYNPNDYKGPRPTIQTDKIPKTLAKLNAKQKLNILYFGDSITVGDNSSELTGCPPFTPIYPKLIVNELKRVYNAEIGYENLSVGGMDSDWGKNQNISEKIKEVDIAVVAFGMNDGAYNVEPEIFKSNIETIIENIRAVNSDVEIILIGCMMANTDSKNYGNQATLNMEMQKISCEQVGIAYVDIGSVHTELLKNKKFIDMTGNCINHPNDFLARVYAMNILSLLIAY
jgi:lysophospholipase L1-like esterase